MADQAPEDNKPAGSLTETAPMAPSRSHDYTDSRKPWDWRTKYPPEARTCINNEACVLAITLGILIIILGFSLALANSFEILSVPLWFSDTQAFVINTRVPAVFFCGSVGGTTFSIKWLIHSAAKGGWHLDRRYWRYFVPLIGGVYACVVLTLFNSGMIVGHASDPNKDIASTAALAFLIGYFSDGVSGLLSNIANAVFGTLREK